MKQKFRLIESNNGNYNFLEIQLLDESYASGLVGSFSTIGSITFQETKGESQWYGMRYVLNTTRVYDLSTFNKIAKQINKNTDYKSQPEDVIKAINGVEYYLFNNEFFKVADKGKRCYLVMRNGEGYNRLVARDDKNATALLEKFKRTSRGRQSTGEFTLGEYFEIQ